MSLNIGKTTYLRNDQIDAMKITPEGDVLFMTTAEPHAASTSELDLPVRRISATTYRLWWTGLQGREITVPFVTTTVTRKKKKAA